MDSEAYLQEMQEDSDNKGTSQPLLNQKLQAHWQVCIVFSLFDPQTSDDMFDVENIEDLEEVSKTLTNMSRKTLTSWTFKGVS